MMNVVSHQKLIESIKEIILPEAILFDMDGVLVDVSASYRLVIKKTAEYFLGKEISLSEIQQYKNRGGYNNDWDITETIILSRGKKIEKEEIIKRFQTYYLGNDFDGLIKNEKWLPDHDVLSGLKKNYKLGIVTGRPRSEAEYVLRRFNSGNFFDVLITMEDIPEGKEKPDPCGIKIAMEKFGVKRAVYLGDTVDDIKSAIDAGATPIGVVDKKGHKSGSKEDKEQKRSLKQHGAIYVLESINEVGEILK